MSSLGLRCLFVLVLLANSLSAAENTEQYAEAYKAATEKGEPLIVLVGTEWCPGCVKMKNQVIPDLQQRGSLDKVRFTQVNADDESELAGSLMQGRSIPQLIMFTKSESGWKRTQLTGPKSTAEVETFINDNLPSPSLIRLTSNSK